MDDFFDVLKLSLGELLRSTPAFVVPRYQRHYAWGKEEFLEFWTDIDSAIDNAMEKQFLGFFVFDVSDPKTLFVVDGQQRITTAQILLAALRNHLFARGEEERAALIEERYLLIPGEDGTPSPHITLNYYDRTFFEERIVNRLMPADLNSLIATKRNLNPSNKNLLECLVFMHDRIGKLLDAGENILGIADDLVQAIENRVGTVRMDVTSSDYIWLIFLRLNNAGADLSQADMIKNYLIGAAGPDGDEIADHWEALTDNLKEEHIIEFIRDYWVSKYSDIELKQLLKSIMDRFKSPGDIVTFVEAMLAASNIYSVLSDPHAAQWSEIAADETVEAGIRRDNRFLHKISRQPKKSLLLETLTNNREIFPEMLRMQTVLLFRYAKVCNEHTNRMNKAMAGSVEHVQRYPSTTPGEVFERFFAQFYPDDATFARAFATYSKKETNVLRHILATINDYISGWQPMTTIDLKQAESLEHILPKRYDRNWSVGSADFPDGAESYVWRLGNLILLPQYVNARAGNLSLAKKKDMYLLEPTHLEISSFVFNQDNWTAADIDRRQHALAELAVKIWRYPES